MARERQRARISCKGLRDSKPSHLRSKVHEHSTAQESPLHNSISHGGNGTANSSLSKPVLRVPATDRMTDPTVKVSERNRRVSIAGVFRTAAKKARKIKPQTSRGAHQKNELLLRLQGMQIFHAVHYAQLTTADGFDIAFAAMQTESLNSLDTIRDTFSESVAAGYSNDKRFAELAFAATEILCTSLLDEQVELEFMNKGNIVTETISIGKRVEHFKKIIEKESAKLSEFWRQWKEIQSEYTRLAVVIFGANSVSGDSSREDGKGTESTMMSNPLDPTHDTGVRGLYNEIHEIHAVLMQKAESSEREIDVAMKREQGKLMQTIMNE